MDAQLVRKGEGDGYIPRKKSARLTHVERYGAYNKASGIYFALIEERLSRARKIIQIPLLEADNVDKYISHKHRNAKVIIPEIDFMSKMIVDGFPVHLAGRSGNGRILYYPAKQLFLPVSKYPYLKKVCCCKISAGKKLCNIRQRRIVERR